MYFIEDGDQLIGKTIAFTHLTQFAGRMVLGTTDGGIMVFEQEDCDDTKEVDIYNSLRAERYLFNGANTYVRSKLIETGVIKQGEYEEWQEKEKQQRLENAKRQKELIEKQEYENFLKLKQKYEVTNAVSNKWT